MPSDKPKYPRISAVELLRRLKNPRLIAPIGLQASGKTTFREALEAQGYVAINGDAIRGELYGDESIQGDSKVIFALALERLLAALSAGRNVVLDLTNLTPSGRAPFVKPAREMGIIPHFVLMDTTLEVCLERNRQRQRHVPEGAIVAFAKALRKAGLPNAEEGPLSVLRQTDELGWYHLIPKGETPNVMRPGGEPLFGDAFDIVGDVHGCYTELLMLLNKLGYELEFGDPVSGRPVVVNKVTTPPGRKLVFVGDLVDRGPASDLVLALVMELSYLKAAEAVSGNHDNKLMRLLRGNPIQPKEDLQRTVDSINAQGQKYVNRVLRYLLSQPARLENDELIVVHAAYRERASIAYAEKLALIGEVDGSRDEKGHPIRLEKWEEEYVGGKVIVHGHVPVLEVVDRQRRRGQLIEFSPDLRGGGRIINVDTSAVFGGKLTALRYPEMRYVQVPALKQYSDRHAPAEE